MSKGRRQPGSTPAPCDRPPTGPPLVRHRKQKLRWKCETCRSLELRCAERSLQVGVAHAFQSLDPPVTVRRRGELRQRPDAGLRGKRNRVAEAPPEKGQKGHFRNRVGIIED